MDRTTFCRQVCWLLLLLLTSNYLIRPTNFQFIARLIKFKKYKIKKERKKERKKKEKHTSQQRVISIWQTSSRVLSLVYKCHSTNGRSTTCRRKTVNKYNNCRRRPFTHSTSCRDDGRTDEVSTQRDDRMFTCASSHLFLNREGRWSTTDDFATSFPHLSLFAVLLHRRDVKQNVLTVHQSRTSGLQGSFLLYMYSKPGLACQVCKLT